MTRGAKEGYGAHDLHRGAELGRAIGTCNGLTFLLKQKQERLQLREASRQAVCPRSRLLWLLSPFVVSLGA